MRLSLVLIGAALAATVACGNDGPAGKWSVNFTCLNGDDATVQVAIVTAEGDYDARVRAVPTVQRACNSVHGSDYTIGAAEFREEVATNGR